MKNKSNAVIEAYMKIVVGSTIRNETTSSVAIQTPHIERQTHGYRMGLLYQIRSLPILPPKSGRNKVKYRVLAQWRRGNAAVCKTAIAGVRFPLAPHFPMREMTSHPAGAK
jgi:hypothetical protein